MIQVKDRPGGSDGGGKEMLGPAYVLKYSDRGLWIWDVRGRKELRVTPWCLAWTTRRVELSLSEMGKTVGGTGFGAQFCSHWLQNAYRNLSEDVLLTIREVWRRAWAGDVHVEALSMWTVFKVKRLDKVTYGVVWIHIQEECFLLEVKFWIKISVYTVIWVGILSIAEHCITSGELDFLSFLLFI